MWTLQSLTAKSIHITIVNIERFLRGLSSTLKINVLRFLYFENKLLSKHTHGCLFTHTAEHLILVVDIHLWVLNVGQVLPRHRNSDPTSRNPFRNFNLKYTNKSQVMKNTAITESRNKHLMT